MQRLLKRALQPALRLLDHADTASCDAPTRAQDTTRFPGFSWDLRTVIAVFPDDSPFRFLNLNITLGLTGVRFDQVRRWTGGDPKDAFEVQLCLEGRQRSATHKRFYSRSRDLTFEPGAVRFELSDRLRFEGRWPGYHIGYRQPDDDLELSIELDSWPRFHWWAYAPRLYCHYTSFCTCRLTYRWNDQSGDVLLPALHDHGWGGNLLPLRLPLALFRYEVLRLPDNGFGISLWTETSGGLELKNVGLLRFDEQRTRRMRRYDCQVLEWERFDNYAGEPRRVPRRWMGHQSGPNGHFTYEAVRRSEPRPIFGDGFMYGFDYSGRIVGSAEQDVEGEGYVEQLGDVPPSVRSWPRRAR